MSILDQILDPVVWEKFYEYKCSLACPKDFAKELRRFIDEKAYEPVCESILREASFPLPKKAIISKQYSQKKRIVYTYPPAENIVLKLLTYLLLRRYDGLFSPGLYSFRPGRSAKDAVRMLRRKTGKGRWYVYKADISNYFNSLPIDSFLPMLKETLAKDEPLFHFLAGLLTEPRVREGKELMEEEKGIMAGTPLASFYANLYLKDLDAAMEARGLPYARYSDDIILFAPGRQEAEEAAAFIRRFLAEKGLSINPEKENYFAPGEPWIFLGFICRDGVMDIAPVSVQKLKAKMRRKTRALKRWQERNGLEKEKAAKAFIRVFNRKLFESPGDHELSWSRWFFPVIGTDQSLKQIDRYAQECLRYLLSGKRSKGRYRIRYEDMKQLGYRSLVHAYYQRED
ncbi:MAG: group II intron reverse transcriptase domain-containing protein [Lachnospiraceae bacterium]|nr:group II intron reverse transcriptase domain-containing protein [Lachnospiraceae bacterium]